MEVEGEERVEHETRGGIVTHLYKWSGDLETVRSYGLASCMNERKGPPSGEIGFQRAHGALGCPLLTHCATIMDHTSARAMDNDRQLLSILDTASRDTDACLLACERGDTAQLHLAVSRGLDVNSCRGLKM